MLFIFPLIYIGSFIFACHEIIKGKVDAIVTFFIFGMSIYTTALSVTYLLGFAAFIPFLQPFKELLVLGVLVLNVIALKTKPRFHVIDYLIFAYVGYMLLYALLPIGDHGLSERLIAFKSNSFYILVYFAARFTDFKAIYINKYFSFVVVITIAAAIISIGEYLTQNPLQFNTGYFDFGYYFYNMDIDGPYGLRTGFDSDSGILRFSSFFISPLDYAAATITALSIILSLYTDDISNRFKFTFTSLIALIATLISITLALSRAPLTGYFLVIYVYAVITHKKLLKRGFQTAVGLVLIYIIYLLYQFENNHSGLIMVLLNTLDFSDPSSASHLLAWAEGIVSIYEHPFGLGLASSGRVGTTYNETVGGENQLIIIGVQAGVIAMILYSSIIVTFIRVALRSLPALTGKQKKVCMAVLLIKIGLLISTFTSEVEALPYVSYMNWFLSGLLINTLMSNPLPIIEESTLAPEYA